MKRNLKTKFLTLVLAGLVNGLLYVNCSGFKGMSSLSVANLSSASCRAKLQAAAESVVAVNDCQNVQNYSCERRVFSPVAGNTSFSSTECGALDGRDVCVNTQTLSFNTEVARSPSSEKEFESGGEFNREEFQCIYNVKNSTAPLFQADGKSVIDALSHSVQHCNERAKQ